MKQREREQIFPPCNLLVYLQMPALKAGSGQRLPGRPWVADEVCLLKSGKCPTGLCLYIHLQCLTLCDTSGPVMRVPIGATTLQPWRKTMLTEVITTTDTCSGCRKKEVKDELHEGFGTGDSTRGLRPQEPRGEALSGQVRLWRKHGSEQRGGGGRERCSQYVYMMALCLSLCCQCWGELVIHPLYGQGYGLWPLKPALKDIWCVWQL